MRPQLPAEISDTRVVAIARGLPRERLGPVAAALRRGGVTAVEVTMDSPDAPAAIAELVATGVRCGAGTVLSAVQAEEAVGAGASFLVTPHVATAVLDWAHARSVPVIAGAFTASEILTAWDGGAAAVKVFPASVGGPEMVRALLGPLRHIPLMPTGGVTGDNAAEYIAAGAAAVGVGGWLVGRGRPDIVEERAAQLMEIIRAC